MRCALPLTALVVALTLAGCAQGGTKDVDSAKDFSGQEAKVAAVVEDLQAAAKDRDGQKICTELITVALQQQIARRTGTKGCTSAVKDAIRETDSADLNVKKVTIKGSSATASVQEKTGDKTSVTRVVLLEFVKEDAGKNEAATRSGTSSSAATRSGTQPAGKGAPATGGSWRISALPAPTG